jgi:hypothetical protein
MFQALKRFMMLPAKQKPTKSRWNEPHSKIATTFQQLVYEQVKIKTFTFTPTPALENKSILNVLQQTEARINNLEAMHITRNAPKTDIPAKAYTDAIKTPVTAAQLHRHQEQQRARAQKSSQP